MRARQEPHLGRDGSDLPQAASVGALAVLEDYAAERLVLGDLERAEHVAALVLVPQLVDQLLAESGQLLRLLVAVGGAKQREEPLVGVLGHPVVKAFGVELGVVAQLGLAERAGGLLLEVDHLLVGLLRPVDGLQDQVFGHLGHAGLDHDDAVPGARDDYIQGAHFELAVGGIDHEAAVDVAHAGNADGSVERDVGHGQRRRGAHEAQHVYWRFLVYGEGREDDLHFVAEALGEERSKGPVGQAGDEYAVGAGPAFAAEEAAGDFAPGVEALFELDGEGEEVDAFPGFAHGGGCENHAVAGAHEHGAVGKLSELAALQCDSFSADFPAKAERH